MSGGSFNYLCHKDVTQIMESGMTDLNEMAEELERLGHLATGPAQRTRDLQARIRDFQRETDEEIAALERVWRGIEWWRSCDWGKDQVFVELGAYREREKSRPTPTETSGPDA